MGILPAILFVLSALISFATGTSWGTFGIMIPLAMPIVTGLAEGNGLPQTALIQATMIAVSAVLSGAVWGDHASPISDTTILSSTGASCPHLEHVATQMPYAFFVAFCALFGFLVGGLFESLALCWTAEIASLARQHNDANVCAIPARFVSVSDAKHIVKAFLDSKFEGGRHQRRVEKIPVK